MFKDRLLHEAYLTKLLNEASTLSKFFTSSKPIVRIHKEMGVPADVQFELKKTSNMLDITKTLLSGDALFIVKGVTGKRLLVKMNEQSSHPRIYEIHSFSADDYLGTSSKINAYQLPKEIINKYEDDVYIISRQEYTGAQLTRAARSKLKYQLSQIEISNFSSDQIIAQLTNAISGEQENKNTFTILLANAVARMILNVIKLEIPKIKEMIFQKIDDPDITVEDLKDLMGEYHRCKKFAEGKLDSKQVNTFGYDLMDKLHKFWMSSDKWNPKKITLRTWMLYRDNEIRNSNRAYSTLSSEGIPDPFKENTSENIRKFIRDFAVYYLRYGSIGTKQYTNKLVDTLLSL